MGGYAIDPADLDALVDLLATVPGLDDLDVDGRPTRVGFIGDPIETPGVVVQVFGYTFTTLDAYAIRARLLLVVPDAAARAAVASLADLLNKVSTVVGSTGEVTHEAVLLPDRGAPLPALSVPITVRCTPAHESE